MRFKKFLLLIATLSLLIVSLGGCGFLKSSKPNTEDINTENVNTKIPDIDESRFTAEKTEITSNGHSVGHFDFVYIITDNQTGKKYLYTYHTGGSSGGAAMVELGNTVEPNTNE